VSPAEAAVGDVRPDHQLDLPFGGDGDASQDQGQHGLEKESPPLQGPPPATAMPDRDPDPKSPPAPPRKPHPLAKRLVAAMMGEPTTPTPGDSGTPDEISGGADGANTLEPGSPDMPSTNHGPDHDSPESSVGSLDGCLDGSSQLDNRKPTRGAGSDDLPTMKVPASGGNAPLPPCPQCGSSNTWRIYGARPGRFACLSSTCQQHFDTLRPGDVTSIQPQMSSHNISQVASGETPEDRGVGEQQQSPHVPVAATGPMTQGTTELGVREGTVRMTIGGEAFGDEGTVHQEPPARLHDEGETGQHESREVA
jgi:hypothetical protein